jgi:hypothetical protein
VATLSRSSIGTATSENQNIRVHAHLAELSEFQVDAADSHTAHG